MHFIQSLIGATTLLGKKTVALVSIFLLPKVETFFPVKNITFDDYFKSVNMGEISLKNYLSIETFHVPLVSNFKQNKLVMTPKLKLACL